MATFISIFGYSLIILFAVFAAIVVIHDANRPRHKPHKLKRSHHYAHAKR